MKNRLRSPLFRLRFSSLPDVHLALCCFMMLVAPSLFAGVPTITSFNLGPNPTQTSATFVVTFSEPVTGVDATDFAINSTGTASATITGISADATGAMHTVAFSYTGSSGSVQMGIKTAGTGIMSSSTSDAFVGGGNTASSAVTVNNTPPADPTLPAVATFTAGTPSGSTVSFTITFSEPVTGVDAGDFLVTRTGTATATLGAIAGTGTTYTIPVTFAGAGTIQLTAIGGATTNIRDTATHWFAGGAGAASAVFTIPTGGTPDTSPPTVASFTTGATTATSVTFNLVFSEPVTSVDTTDFSAATTGGATATIGSVSGSGTSYAITVNFTGTGTVQVALSASGTGILDAASNPLATGASSPVFTISSGGTPPPPPTGVAPTIVSFTLAPNPTPTSGAFVVTFSEAVMGVDATDFALNATGTATGAITGVTQGATAAVYNVAFTYGGTSGSVQAAIKTAGTGIASSASSEVFAGGGIAASAAVTVNNTPPADTNLPAVASFTAGAPTGSAVLFTLTFSEPVTGVDAADFLVTRTGTATATLGAIAPDGAGTTYTIPVTFSGDGTIQLTAIGGATTNIRDAATHWFAGGAGAASAMLTVPTGGGTTDTTPPTVASFTIGATTATSVTFNLVFSEPVTGVDASDFSVASTGGATASLAGISGSGASYAATVNFTGTGTVQLSLNATGTGIVDASANALATGASSPVFTIDGGGVPPSTGTQIIGITTPPDGSYRKGQELVFVVRFSAPVSIRPEPKGGVDDDEEGDNDVGVYFTWTAVGSSDPKRDSGKVHYRSGNGTATLTFSYKVRNGDFAPQGIRMGTTLLPDGIALHATNGTALTSQQLTLPWVQNPLTGVILDAPKLNNGNNGVGIGVGGTPPGHGGTPPSHANPPGHSGTPPQTNPPTTGTGNAGNAPGAVPGNVGSGNAGSGNSTSGNGNPGNGNSNNGNKAGDDKGKDDKNDGNKDKDKEPKRAGAFQPGTPGRLSNLSTRLRVTDADANHSAVAGFVVSGVESKSILVRAVGPGLESFGIRDALEQPRLLLSDSTGRVLSVNDGWSDRAEITNASSRAGAFKLVRGSRDAAVLVSLEPGVYTAQVTGNGNGLVLLEIYDASSGAELAAEKIINISTRGFVGTGEDALVAGFVVSGDAPRRVLIRGVGPTLTAFGVSDALANPVLTLFRDGAGLPVAQSQNWQAASATDLAATMASAGAFPLAAGSRDAALVLTLAPGQYSAVLSGAQGDTGAGLVEIYELP